MHINNHNGTELNNVKETWDQNEKERTKGVVQQMIKGARTCNRVRPDNTRGSK